MGVLAWRVGRTMCGRKIGKGVDVMGEKNSVKVMDKGVDTRG